MTFLNSLIAILNAFCERTGIPLVFADRKDTQTIRTNSTRWLLLIHEWRESDNRPYLFYDIAEKRLLGWYLPVSVTIRSRHVRRKAEAEKWQTARQIAFFAKNGDVILFTEAGARRAIEQVNKMLEQTPEDSPNAIRNMVTLSTLQALWPK